MIMFTYLILSIIASKTFSQQPQQYNFPMQAGQSNQIYLEEYTPKQFYAPFYLFNSENEFNLTLIQSVQEIFNNQSTINNILTISNYVLELGSTSNVFWILTNSLQLYNGVIDQFGEVKTSLMNIKISASNCYNINLINYNYGILTCNTSGLISFLIVNSSSSTIQSYKTSQQPSIIQLFTFISINQISNYTISVVNINQSSTQFLTYYLISNSLSFNSSLTINGSFTQVLTSDNLNYYFLLSENQIVLIDNVMNTTIQLINFDSNQVQKIAIFEMSDNLFRLALLSQQLIQLYIIYPNINLSSLEGQIFIQQPINISIFNMNKKNIYLIADNLIVYIDIPNAIVQEIQSLSISSYLNLNLNIQSAIINQERLLCVLFTTSSIQTFLFTTPFIQITLTQQNSISALNSTYQMNISVISQVTQLQPQYFIINFILVDYQKSQCTIQAQVNLPTLYIEYPTYTTIPESNIFKGPFLNQLSATTYNQMYVQSYVGQPSYILKQAAFVQSNYKVLCAFQYTIPIYCNQYANYSILISQYYQSQIISLNSTLNQNITSCTCFEQDMGEILIVVQFQQQVIVQQLLPLFTQGYQQIIQFNQQVIGVGILRKTLFVVTQDNQLSSYDLLNNSTLMFNYTGQQFKNIYINELSYPNYLFIDNTTNLLILSYNRQNSYEIVNSILYPVTNYNSSTFGILKGGIYLALLLNSTNSELYFYPKSNIFVQNNLQLYFQVSLFGVNIAGPKILSSFTQIHFYLVTLTNKNICCQTTVYGLTGSAFTALIQTISIPSSYFFIASNVVIQYLNNTEVLQQYYFNPANNYYYSENDTISFYYNFTLIPLYVSPTTQNVTTKVSYANPNCSQQVYQNVTITYNQQIIQPLNSSLLNQTCNQTANLQINPSTLFSGNIEYLNATCQNCSSFGYQNPIMQLQYPLDITYQAAIQVNGYLVVQNNSAVYEVYQGQLYQIFTVPGINQTCNYMFVEILSGFLISVCYQNNNTYFYAYNDTQTQNITLVQQIILLGSLVSANYNNGILQIVSLNSNSKFNYNVYYIWVINNTINLSLITQQLSLFSNKYYQFIFLYQSNNFSSDPCQIFGLVIQQVALSGSMSTFYILNTCVPSNLSQVFGYPKNNYTTNSISYFQSVTWNIYNTQPGSLSSMAGCAIQYGDTQLIAEDVVEAQFIVPYRQISYKYFVLFNTTNGNIIGYWQANSYYTTGIYSFSYYTLFQNLDGPLVIVSQFDNSTSANLCVYPDTNNLRHENQLIYNIDCVQFYNFSSSSNMGSVGNYFLMINGQTQQTMVYQIQDHLSLYLNVTGQNTSQIEITAANYFGTQQQIINITNTYVAPNDNDNDNNNNNNDNNNIPSDDDDSKQSHLGLILGVTFGTLILIAIILFLIYRYKRNQQQKQSQSYYELR